MRGRTRSALAASVLTLLVAAPAAAQPSLVPLGQLPGEEGSFVEDLSADGSTVVGTSGPAGFRWTAGTGMVGLGTLLEGSLTAAYAVSDDGSVVVGESGGEAFRWDAVSGMVGLGFLRSEDVYGFASGVSGDGSVIAGGSENEDGVVREAFRWTQSGGMQPLGFLSDATSSDSQGWGVSADGERIVGGSSSAGSGGYESFLWTPAAGIEGLGFLFDDGGGLFGERAYDISADGSTIVGESGSTAFRWTAGTGMVGLDEDAAAAYDASSDGSVVVGETFDSQAFVWDAENGLRRLAELLPTLGVDVTGWELSRAYGVSADGLTIAGSGTNPGGFFEGWLVTLPEPANGLLSGAALLALITLSAFRSRRPR